MNLKKLWNKWLEPKPFNQGYLPIADGHEVWYAQYGCPTGEPILVTHGGPGGSCKPQFTQGINLKKYRVIMFDQRGCGYSKPFGELVHNTTDDILFDMERLLKHLHIKDKVILKGGSWASTIALAFAERYPDKVKKMILSQIFLADEASEKWEQEQSALFYPDKLAELRKPLKKWETIPEYYLKQLTSDNIAQQKRALETYGWFERILGALSPRWLHLEEVDEIELAKMSIYAQYAAAHYYLKNNQLIRNVHKVKHIPTLIVHNRLDMLCPLQGAYNLSQKLDNCKLVIVPERGHVGELLYKTLKLEIKKFLESDN